MNTDAIRAGNQGADSLIGNTIDDKYRIESKLGEGGMGTVYLSTRLMIGDTVAIKILHSQQVSDPQAIERFRREAQAAARLKHQNAVTIYDFGVSNEGLVYLVMELAEGQSLRDIIKQQGPVTPSAAAEIMSQVCAALDAAHRQNIVHRDMKPDNIIVDVTNTGLRVKVLDFGIAKMRDLTASNLTQTGAVMGTPYYMSPEHCMGEELDHRSDIYSLGIVLFEMLAGVVPFNSPISTAVVVQHVNQAPPSLRALNASISAPVEAVVMRALAKRRDLRPQTAVQLAQELIAAVQGRPLTPHGGSISESPFYSTPASTTPAAIPVTGAGLAPTIQMTPPPVISGVRTAASAKSRFPLKLGVVVLIMMAVVISGLLIWASQSGEHAKAPSLTAQWSQTNGPYGGHIQCFAVSGTNLFAGTEAGGVFLSTNNGTSWTAVNTGLTNTDVRALAVSGTNLFAGTRGTGDGGVFLSTNNGTSWTAVNTGLPSNTIGYALAVSPNGAGGTNLFAGIGDGGVFLSTNNGTSWTAVNTGLTKLFVLALAVSGTNVFAGTGEGGVFLSTNNGTTWSAVNTGLGNIDVRALAISGTNLFAGTEGAGVFLSSNNGTNWTAANTGLTNRNVEVLADSGTNLFAGTNGGGVFRSTNDGTSWTEVNTGLMSKSVLAFAVSGTNVFAGTFRGVFRSANNGSNWTEVNTGLMSNRVHALGLFGTNLFAGTQGGIFLSTDNGTIWGAVDIGLPEFTTLSFAVSGRNLFAGTAAGGVFRSGNNGTNWSAVNTGLTANFAKALLVSANGAGGTNLFAGTDGGGVFRSTNSGTSWTAVNIGIFGQYVQALAVSGMNLFAGTPNGVLRSTNNGTSWTLVNTGLTKTDVRALAVSGTSLFAGTLGGVFRSTNNGTNWTEVNTGLMLDTANVNTGLMVNTVNVLAVSGTSLFAGTYDGGVFLSTNDGASWTAVNTGLTNGRVTALAVSGANLFAGTSGGVWTRPLSEMITSVH